MASTHTDADNAMAHGMGWRTFRTVANITQLSSLEILCPASPEGGNRETCSSCGACNGSKGVNDKKMSIAIVAHGGGGKTTYANEVINHG